jgi:hypothetical protein
VVPDPRLRSAGTRHRVGGPGGCSSPGDRHDSAARIDIDIDIFHDNDDDDIFHDNDDDSSHDNDNDSPHDNGRNHHGDTHDHGRTHHNCSAHHHGGTG